LSYKDVQEVADLDGSSMGTAAGASIPGTSADADAGVGAISLGYGEDGTPSSAEGFNPDDVDGERVRADQLSGTSIPGSGLETIYFEFDSAEIRQDQWDKVQRNARIVNEYPDAAVIVEGHCDERGTDEYNLGLSDRRAESIRKALISLGVSTSRMTSVPYGESRPVDARKTEEAWAKNRRVQFGDTDSTLTVSSL
jgi:peptidoglycan-associated lipoprotein